jgi:hypothetical protein
MTSAQRVVMSMSKNGPAEELAGLNKMIDKQSVLIERGGGDPSALARLSTRLSIEGRIRLMPGQTEAASARILSQRLPTYGPAAYAPEGRLPPAVYTRGKPLALSERQVSRIVEIPSDLELPLTIKTTNGLELTLHGAPGQMPKNMWGAASDVGSATRLLFPTQRIVIVNSCSDTDDALPPCHEPLSGEDRQEFERIKREICDTNGDGTFSTAAERECLAEMGKCDQDFDGVWGNPTEVECLVTLRRSLQ